MRKQFICALAVVVLPAVAFAAGGGVSTATTPGSASSTSTVTLDIPGIVGVDVESDVAFNFAYYTPGAPLDGCLDNTWPLSASCTAGTVHFDPNLAVGPPPVLGTTTTAGLLPAPSAINQDTAIWLAVFCSEPVGTFVVELEVSPLLPATSGLTSDNIVTKKSGSNNAVNVGNASFLSFLDNAFHDISTADTLGATFGWTRIDQAVALEFPATTTLTKGIYTSTLTYRVSK